MVDGDKRLSLQQYSNSYKNNWQRQTP